MKAFLRLKGVLCSFYNQIKYILSFSLKLSAFRRFLHSAQPNVISSAEMMRWGTLRALKPFALYLLPLKILFCVCLAHAGQREALPAATGVALAKDSIKPLKIGDTIPDALWNLPLQMVKAGQEGSTTVTLNDYKGKLIILDFWATWCGTCVAALPKLQRLQERFEDQLAVVPITFQSKAIVGNFLQENHIGKQLHLPFISDGKRLSNIFPHKLISHLVWIDERGVLRATTWSEYAKEDNVKSMLKGDMINWSMKIDVIDFNVKESFFGQGKELLQHEKTRYSLLTGHLNGINPTTGEIVDSVKQIRKHYIINARIVPLCVRAWNKPLPELTPKQYLYNGDINRYVKPDSGYRDEWNQENTYCYEAVVDISITENEFARLLAEDLRRYLKVEGHLEKRNMECIIIHKTDVKRKKGSKPIKDGITMNKFIWLLNTQMRNLPFAVDETGDATIVMPQFATADLKLRDIEELLAKEGLKLSKEFREIDVFVINEIN